jgi:hypothetical protein
MRVGMRTGTILFPTTLAIQKIGSRVAARSRNGLQGDQNGDLLEADFWPGIASASRHICLLRRNEASLAL